MELNDKVIVITGAASGIGREMARRFKKEGARQIVIADMNPVGLIKVAEGNKTEEIIALGSAESVYNLINDSRKKILHG